MEMGGNERRGEIILSKEKKRRKPNLRDVNNQFFHTLSRPLILHNPKNTSPQIYMTQK